MTEEEVKEIDIAGLSKVRILAGSNNHIIIEKLYGPTSVKDLSIVWEKDDWNVRNMKKLKRQEIKSEELKISGAGNHKYLSITDSITNLTTQYHLFIQKKIIEGLSVYQLKRLIKLSQEELKKRKQK